MTWELFSSWVIGGYELTRKETDQHRCLFPIGWLMKKEGFEETPLTTGK